MIRLVFGVVGQSLVNRWLIAGHSLVNRWE